MAFRANYWSNSKFAVFLRKITGASKPGSATSQGWMEWDDEYKKKWPITYWVTENALDTIQDFLYWPLDYYHDLRRYIRNRYIIKSHILSTDLKPGTFYETDEVMLQGLFNALTNFVEIECASMQQRYYNYSNAPFWYRYEWLRWGVRRSRELGIQYLESEMGVIEQDGEEEINPDDARVRKATEIYSLYIWWKDIRPTRRDAYEITGYHELCERQAAQAGNNFSVRALLDAVICGEDRDQRIEKMNESIRLEELQYEEDTAMMVRLVKIRQGLWT